MNKQTKLIVCAVALAVAITTGARADQAADATATNAVATTTGQPTGKPEGHEATPPATKDWSVTLGGDYFSEYIFRGVNVSSSTALLAPSAIAKYKGFAASYYGYYSDGSGKHNRWYEETDLSLDYTKTFVNDKLSVTGGGVYYLYPDGNSGIDTWELYGKASWACYLNPYIGLNWDIDSGAGPSGLKGGYGVVGITHSYDLTAALKMKDGQTLAIVPMAQLGIDFGWTSKQTQSNIDWNDVLLGVSVPYYIMPSLCVHAGIQVSIALNSLCDINQHNDLIGNVGVSYSF